MAARIDTGTWWQRADRAGFTSACLARFCSDDFVYVDDVSTADMQVMQRRIDLLATAQAVQQARQTGALRRAVVLERN